ncbi:MAG: methionyl-tRNA formyltransferase [Clostridia bacterium]|nr:methionyl-tRNA formyltransferase [Clostridia bacterium]
MGTPDFAKESLEGLVEAGYDVAAVVTNPDKPKGRGMKMIFSPVKEYAVSKGLEVLQPVKIRNNDEFIEKIKTCEPDVICVVAYGKIIPKEILEIPKLGCINVHGSLLPKYRGAAPIQWAVLNGEKKTGITTMFMDIGMDTGDMVLKEEVEIGEDETTGELWDRLSKIGADLLVKTISLIEKGEAPREKQDESEATYAPMLTKEIGKINWSEYSSQRIKNLVRGLNPIMGAYTFLDERKLKIWKTECIDRFSCPPDTEPGTILESSERTGLYVKTIDEVISILEIQAENSKRMNIKDYLRGNKIEVGKVLK